MRYPIQKNEGLKSLEGDESKSKAGSLQKKIKEYNHQRMSSIEKMTHESTFPLGMEKRTNIIE